MISDDDLIEVGAQEQLYVLLCDLSYACPTGTAPRWAVRIFGGLTYADDVDRRAVKLAAESEQHRSVLLALLEGYPWHDRRMYESVRAYLVSVGA